MSRISIAPSKAHIWTKCSGSSLMSAVHKDEVEQDRTHADEGTTGHKLAEMLLLDRSLNPHDVIGTVHEETGVVFDDAMWDGAVMYVDYIASVVSEGAKWEVEAELPVPSVHEHSKVIIDCYSYDSLTRHLDIFDYKYGFRLVEAYKNLQLIHGTSAVVSLCERESIEPPQTVTFHIVQPRGFHHQGPCRVWDTTVDQLRSQIVGLKLDAEKVFRGSTDTTSGSHCFGCAGMHRCSTYRSSVFSALDYIGKPMSTCTNADEESVELEILIQAEKLVSERKTTLQEKIKHRLKRGESVHGFELKENLGNRTWSMDADAVIAMGESMGIDLLKKKTPVTPAEAVRRGLSKEIMEDYVKRPSLGMKLHHQTKTEIERLLKI